MKKLVPIILVLLAACGSTSEVQHVEDLTPTVEMPAEVIPEEVPQPFLFEGASQPMLAGMLIDLAILPSGHWMVAARDGNVFLLDSERQIMTHDFISSNTYQDNGVMGFALANDFETSGLVYFYFTAPDNDGPCFDQYCTRVVEYKLVEGPGAFLTEERVVLNIPLINRLGQHIGGGIEMGPDNLLYVGIGEGSPVGDEINYSQDLSSPLGKLLAIDPVTGDFEVAALGLRNPFTSALREDGIFIADVGGELYEELNFYEFGSMSPTNFGWPLAEGPGQGFVEPIGGFLHCSEDFTDEDPYGHDEEPHELKTMVKLHNGVVHTCGNEVITVMGTYPEADDNDPYDGKLDGAVFYSDLYYGSVRALNFEDGIVTKDRHIGHFPGLTSMIVGPDGYLYGVSISYSQMILKMTPNPDVQ